jgi:LPXTG-motif cell wall-anchored protein
MNPVTIILILALLIALWWLLRKRRENVVEIHKPSTVQPGSGNSQFHAVSIRITGQSCRAAQEMSGRRFLATAAPKLPLPECDVLECKCRFAHHDDRRSNKDRRSPFRPGGVAGSTGSFASEQRGGEDRRKSDH